MNLILSPGAFRLVLALMVLVSHASRLQSGRVAVILFFVLSGYWVSDLWLQREKPNLARFYLNRFIRIWPLYFIIAMAVNIYFGRVPSIWNVILFGVSSVDTGAEIGPEWSLDIELQFYLIMPALHIVWDRTSSVMIGVLSILSFFAGWALFYYFHLSTVLMYLPAFVVGMAIFRLRWELSPNTALAGLLLTVALVVVLLSVPVGQSGLLKPGKLPVDDTDLLMRWDGVAFLLAIPVIPYLIASLRRRSGKLDRHLGDFSYPLYLVHAPALVFLLVAGWWKPMALLGAVAASALVYLVIDRPIERWRRAFLSRRSPTAPLTD